MHNYGIDAVEIHYIAQREQPHGIRDQRDLLKATSRDRMRCPERERRRHSTDARKISDTMLSTLSMSLLERRSQTHSRRMKVDLL